MYRIFDKVTEEHKIGMITEMIYRQAAALIMEKLVNYKWEPPVEDSYLDEGFGHTRPFNPILGDLFDSEVSFIGASTSHAAEF